eukprot:scaffold237_cov233-Pinguiococcus_pyrenoidosus.AAC.9
MLAEGRAAPGEHPLHRRWALRVHFGDEKGEWAGLHRVVATVASVEEFWRALDTLPHVSDVFFDGVERRRLQNRLVESFSLFEEGVEPIWEDPHNAKGGEYACKDGVPPDRIDGIWEDLLCAVVGEVLDPGREITGVRVVDKSGSSRKRDEPRHYRVELWLRSQRAAVNQPIKDDLVSLVAAVCQPDDPLKPFTFRRHTAR